MKPRIAVLGAGVSGLSTGIRLLERGYPVEIIARDLPPHTTSNRAAAIWYPYRAYPEELVLAWGRATYREFFRLIDDAPEAGVRAIQLLELCERSAGDPWWQEAVDDFRRARPEELPAGYADAYVVRVPVIDTSHYLDYLVDRFLMAGGTIEQRAVSTLEEAADGRPVMVNCAGLGARDLAGDEEVFPIRGQIVRVRAPRVMKALIDEDERRGLTYIIPRTNDVILGGTDQENDWRTAPDLGTAKEILDRCLALDPALMGLEILQHEVGLRPGRRAVRLESERFDEFAVVHNYGHGGAGFTLSWGCAAAAADLVDQASREGWGDNPPL